jgi:hypothetical protein
LENARGVKLLNLKVLKTRPLNHITDKDDEKDKIYRHICTSSVCLGSVCFKLSTYYAYSKRCKS